jgi:CheY-like chemotaxis protein
MHTDGAREPTERRTTVLIAEDDPDDRALISDALDECCDLANIRFVPDGEELMDYLRGRGRYADRRANPPPGLVLLDLKMPKKDGFDVLTEAKGDRRLRRIPVVVLSTSRSEADVARSYELGVNSYISKPHTFDELVHAMETLVHYWFDIVDLAPAAGA